MKPVDHTLSSLGTALSGAFKRLDGVSVVGLVGQLNRCSSGMGAEVAGGEVLLCDHCSMNFYQ